jgi:hypothetical protein
MLYTIKQLLKQFILLVEHFIFFVIKKSYTKMYMIRQNIRIDGANKLFLSWASVFSYLALISVV